MKVLILLLVFGSPITAFASELATSASSASKTPTVHSAADCDIAEAALSRQGGPSDEEKQKHRECKNQAAIKKQCEGYKPEAEKVQQACSKAGLSGKDCIKTFQECSKEPKSKRAQKKFAEKCAFVNKISYDDAKEAHEDAKDDFEDSGEKLSDLQDKLQEMQEDALEAKQDAEEKINKLQQKLQQIPQKANELALQNEAERDKLMLSHIDNMNKVADDLQALQDAFHDAESALNAKRNELLQRCEDQARAKIEARLQQQNAAKAAGKFVVKSLSDAISTSRKQNCSKLTGSKNSNLRSTCKVVQDFNRCQKTRLFQSGIQTAERSYQRALMTLESRRKSVERQYSALETKLQNALKLNQKAAELQMAQLANEQNATAQEILMLQKQMFEQQQQAQTNIQQVQQEIQKAQFEQFQKMQGLVVSQNIMSQSKSGKRNVKLSDDDIENINEVMSIVGNSDDSFNKFIRAQASKCLDYGVYLPSFYSDPPSSD